MARDYRLEPFRAPVDLQIDYARELNPQQYLAVTAAPGPALVIAGAGTGKTRTLTYRVAYLLEQGVPAEQILLLTFTNKAAQEMMRRVDDLLGRHWPALWGGTFHSIGNRLLRRHAEAVGYRSDFTILDREDAEQLLRACLTEARIEDVGGRFPKAGVLGEILTLAVNRGEPVAQVLAAQFELFVGVEGRVEAILAEYQRRKRQANLMDFDDLLALWSRLFQEHEDVRGRYQERFQFILVDEYQDTNRLQSELIDLLAARHRHLMVVGDDAQSIYSWRGADFRNILEFPQRYPDCATYRIETNYRSTPEILEVANAAIAPNRRQFPKQLAPARRSGPKPAVVVCAEAGVQSAFVASRVFELHEEGVALRNIAVLYRSHFHAMELQMELRRWGIPHVVTSGIRFFEQAHIKDVTAYLRVAVNWRDEVAFKRLVVMLPGVGAKGAARIWTGFQEGGQLAAGASPIQDSPEHPPVDPPIQGDGELGRRLRACAGCLPKRTRAYWPQFAETLEQLAASATQGQPGELIRLVLDAGYEDYLRETYENSRSRLEDLAQLASFAQNFPNLNEFLGELALLSNVEAEAEGSREPDDDRLRLSTIHQAKGLEFDVVFVIMLCDGLFPSERSLEQADAEEEERRLFYVAITRARNELYLSYPVRRSARGYETGRPLKPSRFLEDIRGERVEQWSLKAPKTRF